MGQLPLEKKGRRHRRFAKGLLRWVEVDNFLGDHLQQADFEVRKETKDESPNDPKSLHLFEVH